MSELQRSLDPYENRILALHSELGIPRDYSRRGVILQRETNDLVSTKYGRFEDLQEEFRMTTRTLEMWESMRVTAARDGIKLYLTAAFRSAEDQAELFRMVLRQGNTFDNVVNWILAPRYSEYHTGEALDIGATDIAFPPSGDNYEVTSTFAWLNQNADTFGFSMTYPRNNRVGLIYEPWHWRSTLKEA